MEAKRITLLLPSDVIEAAEREAKKHKITRHNFLVNLIISQLGEPGQDENVARFQEISDLQRVCISILARMWGEQNPDASQIIRGMIMQERKKK